MLGHWTYALTVGPLGLYFWLLAIWHSQRHPKVVSGLTDFGLLTLGVGGLLTFGPFGQFVAHMLFRRPDAFDWLAIVSGMGLAACWFARRSLNRFVIYHVHQPDVVEAVRQSLDQMERTPFVRTLAGFEDAVRQRRITIEQSPWLRSAVVEVHGPDADQLSRSLRDGVRRRLRSVSMGISPIAIGFYVISITVLLLPTAAVMALEPHARATLRTVIHRLLGG